MKVWDRYEHHQSNTLGRVVKLLNMDNNREAPRSGSWADWGNSGSSYNVPVLTFFLFSVFSLSLWYHQIISPYVDVLTVNCCRYNTTFTKKLLRTSCHGKIESTTQVEGPFESQINQEWIANLGWLTLWYFKQQLWSSSTLLDIFFIYFRFQLFLYTM